MPSIRLYRALHPVRPAPEPDAPHPVEWVVGLVAALGAVWLGVCVALGLA